MYTDIYIYGIYIYIYIYVDRDIYAPTGQPSGFEFWVPKFEASGRLWHAAGA